MSFLILTKPRVQPGLGQLGGTQNSPCLGKRLLPLSIRVRISHNAGTCLDMNLPVLDHRCANRNRQIHVTVEAQIADRAQPLLTLSTVVGRY